MYFMRVVWSLHGLNMRYWLEQGCAASVCALTQNIFVDRCGPRDLDFLPERLTATQQIKARVSVVL